MKTCEICSLPLIKFAHAYQADSYRNHFIPLKNCIETSYIVEGEVQLKTKTDTYYAKKGDIICQLYTEDVHLEASGFHAHRTACASIEFQMFENNIDLLYLPLVTASSADTTLIRQMIDQLVYDPSSYLGSAAKGAGWFLRILSEIDRCNRKANALHLPGEMLYVQKARDYIHRHINEPLTQKQVAEHLGISPGYLCEIFRKVEQTTLMQYVNRQKLSGIRMLMEQKHLKLNEAASLYGYADPNYVSRLYKKLFQHNITDKPTKY